MTITDYLGLSFSGKAGFEAYDVDLDKEDHAFVSYDLIEKVQASWAKPFQNTLADFSQFTCNCILADDVTSLLALGKIGHEENAFRLGFSKGDPKGTGSSLALALDDLKKSGIPLGLNQSRLVGAFPILQRGIGVDRESDILCCILVRPFIDYTVSILSKYGVAFHMERKNETRAVWNPYTHRPESMFVSPPFIDELGIPLILVPDEFVTTIHRNPASQFYERILSAKRQGPNWPTKSGKGGRLVKISKKEYKRMHPGLAIKEEIASEMETNQEQASQLLNSFLSGKKAE